jgi:hypothetical protein
LPAEVIERVKNKDFKPDAKFEVLTLTLKKQNPVTQ